MKTFLSPVIMSDIQRLRRLVEVVTEVKTVGDPILTLENATTGEVTVWFATDRETFITLEDSLEQQLKGNVAQEVESFEPTHWGPGPHNV
jgi:hypothetical protein